eukprot:scaffold27_cov355-Prasinococcus_capsulatus_cf.AAC.17
MGGGSRTPSPCAAGLARWGCRPRGSWPGGGRRRRTCGRAQAECGAHITRRGGVECAAGDHAGRARTGHWRTASHHHLASHPVDRARQRHAARAGAPLLTPAALEGAPERSASVGLNEAAEGGMRS